MKNEISSMAEGTQYLVIEDFQTYGLDGSVIESDILKIQRPSDIISFGSGEMSAGQEKQILN
ncbi:MAG: hypothetical protein IPP72_12840 [Chitinophagaceae bacterium]|nr:hypothetical protein [Chitinophagaceae bacterium]